MTPDPHKTILLTGATGYIGGRLLHRLQDADRHLRCLTRRPEALAGEIAARAEIVAGDLLDSESLTVAMRGVHTAYYLVHSMGASGDFKELDRLAAANFAGAARDAGVARIIYLGGLGSGDDLSEHLASRHEVGRILHASGIVTIELRASIVIGSGSASFETVRAVVDRLPAIPAPSWVETAAQPIAIEDVIDYLVAANVLESTTSAVFEIGGGDRVSYADVMREYARQRNLRRRMIRMPLVTARASRLLLGVLTPTYGRIASAMVDSLRNETVVRGPIAREAFSIEPRGLAEAIERTLASEDREFAETHWSEALAPTPKSRWGGVPFGRRMVSSRVVRVKRRADQAFVPIQRIGGYTGWYALDWFWSLRGLLDTLRGGTGLRRGRRDPHELRVGDAIDFWRVERFEPGRRLVLAAEMRIPGRLWLEFEVEPDDDGSRIRQTTVFDPAGYVGRAYWYLLYPVHSNVFRAMLRGLRRATFPEDTQHSPRRRRAWPASVRTPA
ncbi:MAG: NAD-dependent epimerase/dehydratase [Solirubrobacterales bacterium]|nr:NAD-dependent epimerase/dehydratase [Solirubrobacterales bacterium]